jgi:hypothetical protein
MVRVNRNKNLVLPQLFLSFRTESGKANPNQLQIRSGIAHRDTYSTEIPFRFIGS